MPVFFISHGGGPWPFVEEMRKLFIKSETWLSHLPETLPQAPKAILSVTSHWEEDEFTVGTATNPPMLYDYSGFPTHTYQVKYPAPGLPALALRIKALALKNGISLKEDSGRGFDHGTFVPLSLIYPKAEIPVVQLSIKRSYSPLEHLHLGETLESLRDEGILIIGSGLSYHNLSEFGSKKGMLASEQFEKWLTESVEQENEKTRTHQLINWEHAPSARVAHPSEDHLIPLMVAAGAAGSDKGKKALIDNAMNVTMASYRFG